jgi:hypothetical protein
MSRFRGRKMYPGANLANLQQKCAKKTMANSSSFDCEEQITEKQGSLDLLFHSLIH